MSADVEYHLGRARAERDRAYRAANALASDAHVKLSALHLQHALVLQEVRRRPVGNISPLKPSLAAGANPEPAIIPDPLLALSGT